MSQPSRWVSRLARVAMVVGTVVSFGAASLAAQGTAGKIEGTIRDQSGAPIAGAQVLIVGSAFAGVSNEQGYYFINNVPAGVMTVRAQYIGYRPAEVRNVRVFAGQTFTVNLALEPQAVEVTGITVIAEQNPIVPRDQVTSKPIVGGDVIENLPVDAVSQVLRLQPGVVESANGLTIRGGRPGEAAIYVDGVRVRSVSGNTGAGTGLVGTNALEEVSVTTGAIGAEMGDAQAGVIALVTRSGTQRFRGSFSLSSDEFSGETYGAGVNRLEASLGGPLRGNLTWFLATTMTGSQNGRQGIGAEDVPLYVMNGVDTAVTVANTPGNPTSDSSLVAIPSFERYSSGSRRPDDNSDTWTLDANLKYSYGTGSRISLAYHRQRSQDLFGRGTNLYNAMAQRGSRDVSRAITLNWSQNLARSSERALFLDAKISFQREESVDGLVDGAWFQDNRDPFANFTFSSMRFVSDLDNFPIDDRLVQNIRVGNCDSGRDAARPNMGGCVPFLNRADDLSTSNRGLRFNPYGTLSYAVDGVGTGGPALDEESRVSGNVTLDWQANRYNRVRLGGDFERSDVGTYVARNWTAQSFMDANRYTPSKVGLFFTDRLDLGDVVVDLGLRYDRLNSGILYPRTPGRIYTDPLRQGNLSRALTAEDTTVANRCAQLQTAADTTNWATCNFFEAEARSVLAPSIRVSFPVTDRTGFRLSYAHQVESPRFNLLATGVNADLGFTNTNDVFGRDLDYGKSILFEFGLRHAFSDDMVLDISAYNKDKVSDITARIVEIYDPQRNETQNLNLMTNADFGNVRGVDVKLDRRFGSIFQGSFAYTYLTSRSTGSNPFEYLNTLSRQISAVTGDRVPPPQALLTTADSRTHTIAGSLTLNFPHGWHSGTLAGSLLQSTGMFATFRFASGLPYTPILNEGDGTRGPGNGFGLVGTGLEELNGGTMPWIRNVDLRVTRGFRLGGRDLTVFGDFRNLFNWTNLTAIFAETGDVVNALHREEALTAHLVNLRNEASSEPFNLLGSDMSINLTNCSRFNADDSSGLPNCLMLRRTEALFAVGTPDGIFTLAEQTAAYYGQYNLFNGPQTLKGPGFNMRLGFELNF